MAGRRADVHADLEGRLVRLRNAALLHVGQHVLQALGQALALGLDQLGMDFRVGGKKVGRRHRVDHLLHREADLLALARTGLDRIGQGQHEFAVQQVGCGGEGGERAGRPLRTREALVVDLGRLAGHEVLPQLARLLQVILAQGFQPGRREGNAEVLEHTGERIGAALRGAGGGHRGQGGVHPALPGGRIGELVHPGGGKSLGVGHVHVGVRC